MEKKGYHLTNHNIHDIDNPEKKPYWETINS